MKTVRPVVVMGPSITLIYPDGTRIGLDPASINAILEALVNYGWLSVDLGPSRHIISCGQLALTSDENGGWCLAEIPMAGCSSNGKLRLDDGNEL